MLKKAFCILLIIFAAGISSLAQKAYVPGANSKESKVILTVLKTKIEADGETKAVIIPYFFRVQGNWAFLSGIPKKNSTVDQYENNVKALLKKSGGKWGVVKYLVGADDFAAFFWSKEFNAPKAIFPWIK